MNPGRDDLFLTPVVTVQRLGEGGGLSVWAVHPSRLAALAPQDDGMRSQMGAHVYILRCADGSYYVGSATGNDLWRRMAEHESGIYRGYTYSRRPVELVWAQHFD